MKKQEWLMIQVFETVLPIFLLVALGFILKEKKWMPQEFAKSSNWFVFYVAAPALLFRSAAHAPIGKSFDHIVILTVIGISIFIPLFYYPFTGRMKPPQRGVFLQGSFRSNLVFVGLPVLMFAYGKIPGLMGGIANTIGFTVPVYNMLAVVILTIEARKNESGKNFHLESRKIYGDIISNPLIIGSFGGIAFSYFNVPLPKFIDNSLFLLAGSAAPVALVVVGTSLNFNKLKGKIFLALLANINKLMVYPALAFAVFVFLHKNQVIHFSAIHKAVVVLLSSPTAVAAHIMAKEMKGDEELSASIIVLGTSLSFFTMSLWLILLSHYEKFLN